MQGKIKEIAARVRELRELSDVPIEQMAAFLDVPADVYAKYEAGEADIPASILYEIAHKLGVDLGTLLTGEEPRMHVFTVTRRGHGASVERRKQYKYQDLAANFIHAKAEPFLVTVEPSPAGAAHAPNAHPGQEFDFVLEGRLRVFIHNNELTLEEGDAIFFDSKYEHAMEALDGKAARFLAVIM